MILQIPMLSESIVKTAANDTSLALGGGLLHPLSFAPAENVVSIFGNPTAAVTPCALHYLTLFDL